MSFEIRRVIQEKVKQSQRVLIILPLGSWREELYASVSFVYLLESLGKEAYILMPSNGELPREFQEKNALFQDQDHIIGDTIIEVNTQKHPIKELRYNQTLDTLQIFLTPDEFRIPAEAVSIQTGTFRYDLILTLNVLSDPKDAYSSQVSELIEHVDIISFSTAPLINPYTDISWIEAHISGISEMIFMMMKESYQPYFSRKILNQLRSGLEYETKQFTSKKTSPRTHLVVAELMERGAEISPEYLKLSKDDIAEVHSSRSLEQTKLLGRVLSHVEDIQISDTIKLSFSKLYSHDFEKTGTTNADIYQIIREIQSLTQTQQGILHIMIESSSVKQGVLITKDSELMSKIQSKLDGEMHLGAFRYSYPSQDDVHQACSEVNQIITESVKGSHSQGDLVQ